MVKTSSNTCLNLLAANSGALATKSVSAKGTVGTNLDVTPAASSNNVLYKMILNAPLATDDATVIIYKDSVAAGNILYTGYMADRDVNGAITIPAESTATTKWIVVVTGGSGTLIASAKYN